MAGPCMVLSRLSAQVVVAMLEPLLEGGAVTQAAAGVVLAVVQVHLAAPLLKPS